MVHRPPLTGHDPVTAPAVPTLCHIPLSHYNEKVRWALDYKGIPHVRRVPGFDYLIRNWLATRQGKLPILWLDGQPVCDSTRIIAALEARHPDRPLYPADGDERQRALVLEDDLDETLGPSIRAAILGPVFRRDPEIALRLVTTGMGDNYRMLRPLLKIFPAYYRFRHRISDDDLENDRARVAAALDRIEHARAGRDYLVGDAFTVADLTAAALLSPVLQPPEIQYPHGIQLPDYMTDYAATVIGHPAAQWAMTIYRRHRGGSAAVKRR